MSFNVALVQHSEGDVRTGKDVAEDELDVFLPYQIRVCADTRRIRVIEKSRRIGMSWALAGDCVLEAAVGEWNVYYMGYNLDMARQFIADSAEFARAYQLVSSDVEETVFEDTDADGETRKILTFAITFASGCTVHALTSHPRNFRSRQGHAIIDEAAFHPDLNGILKAALAFLIWGKGRVTIISSHNGVDNPFNVLCEDIRKGRKRYGLHHITFDDACNDGLYERICLRNGVEATPTGYQKWRQGIIDDYGDDADEELFCVPHRSGGAYIPAALIEKRMIPGEPIQYECDDAFAQMPIAEQLHTVSEWCEAKLKPLLDALQPPENEEPLPHFFGEDFGRTADLTVIAPMRREQNLRRRCPWLVELRNMPMKCQEVVLFYIVDRLPNFLRGAMDGGGNGAYLAESAQERYGSGRIEVVNFSEKWYAEHLPKFKASFEDDTIAVPRDADVLKDIQIFQTINGIPKPAKLRTDEQRGADGKDKKSKRTRHGDAGIALLLAHHAANDATVDFAFM